MANKIYKEKELGLAFYLAVSDAKKIWAKKCAEELAIKGDWGTCVIGAGISIDILPPRCKYPREKMIISASEVCRAQGSVIWEASVNEVLAFLASKGIEAYYNCGNMD